MGDVLGPGECGEDDFVRLVDRLNRGVGAAWDAADFDQLARLHALDVRVEGHRSIGRMSYVGLDEFRRQTWGLRDLFPSATITLIEIAAPVHFMNRLVLADSDGNEVVMLSVVGVTNGVVSSIRTFDESNETEARAHMLRIAAGSEATG